ncbi:MAG TPA: hypothetical protein VFC71_04475 [Candidatus Polarisedimenticolia bacterium]|nr:hypothetical protein [Candidatus Polarisedimenticolia bacterium]
MTAPSTVCPNCGEDVPFGRRTCEACGANLTAVGAPTDEAADEPEVAQAPEVVEVAEVADGAAATSAATADDAGWDAARAEAAAPADAAPPPPAAMEAFPEPPTAEPAPAPFVPPVLRDWNAGSPTPETGFAAELAAAQGEASGLAGAWLPPSTPTTRAPLPDSTVDRAAIEWPDSPPESRAPLPDPARTPPNAMPASLAEMLQRTSTSAPRWPGADERTASGLDSPTAGVGEPDESMIPPSRMPDLAQTSRPSSALPPEARPLEPGRAPLFADLPFDAPDTLPGWLVAAGGGLATISFVLPWIDRPDSYFSAWGLGDISNLPIFLIAFGVTALAVLPSRLADWLRHGMLGLAVGSFILGITWHRLVGATGSQLGVILEATGALLLLIGGILAIVRDRGAADGPRERG